MSRPSEIYIFLTYIFVIIRVPGKGILMFLLRNIVPWCLFSRSKGQFQGQVSRNSIFIK